MIDGAKVISKLPKDPNFAIIHDKTMARQEKQNMFLVLVAIKRYLL
jgi:hypothetical protein